MYISKRLFPEVILDNEEAYFSLLSGVIDSVDELSSLEITKALNGYHFRVAPSTPRYNKMLLEEILRFHNLMQIKVDLSKSIKASSIINFTISLQ